MGICDTVNGNSPNTGTNPNLKNRKDNNVVYKRINQVATDSPKIQEDILNDYIKSICLISYNEYKGTGFFIILNILNNTYKCMITNYHLVSDNLVNNIINIQIYDKSNIKIKLENRFMKFYNSLDITIIEIKESDKISKDIKFLNYDSNYIEGYEQYLDLDIFALQYPDEKCLCAISGKITDIFNKCEFSHNINIDSYGAPIFLSSTLKPIGIIKKSDNKNEKYGSFIGEIFEQNNKDKIKNNFIIGEINISEKEVGKEIRIINSYEESLRKLNKSIKEEYKNEKQIKECKIEINNQKIFFDYFYRFEKSGKHKIKYIFENFFPKINYMFFDCSSLTYLNLSNFNTENVTDMSWMFFKCISLENLNLSNFSTQKVINMRGMFSECSSLKNLNLSYFNTQNVTDMSWMFFKCSSLENLNLPHLFNTQNVTDMSWMFYNCSSLQNLNLSNFNTQNATDMSGMFNNCPFLTKIALSKFKSQDDDINDLKDLNNDNKMKDIMYNFYDEKDMGDLDDDMLFPF